MRFLIVNEDDIASGVTTDKYFLWTEEVLRSKGLNPRVVAEVTTSTWGIFVGVNDVLRLLEGRNVDVYSMPEGCLFFPHEPVLTIVGKYLEFARFETAILGFICHPSAVATQAFKFKLASGKKILSFGTRRMHPALSAVIERSAYIGGVDGVSNFSAEKYLGIESVGTMPHALIICFGDQVEAWKSYDEVVDERVPRIMLVDTYYDEKTEAILAVENVDRVDGVRLDTPSSRRGDMRKIVEEVRWELDVRGRRDVKIVVSGGLSLRDVVELSDVVDVFGVGTAIAGAKPIDFAMDIVEVEGRFAAKRGKRGGMKQVYRVWDELRDEIKLFGERGEGEPLIQKVMENGRILKTFDLHESRDLVLRQMEIVRRLGIEERFLN
ncbi:MAG: nicotinate phosphoribosyltransferase [Archaeoglobales archaeon]|nr:MAG: nicotinate phosphoribosyltransferase [Archaeoglobales archaeon]